MDKHSRSIFIIGLAILFLLMTYSSCELPKTLYSIKMILGNGIDDDSSKISIWVTGMEPGDGGNNLSRGEWYPTEGYLDYEVYLSKPGDFTVFVESGTQSYSRSFEIEDSQGYSFYFASKDPDLAIQGSLIDF